MRAYSNGETMAEDKYAAVDCARPDQSLSDRGNTGRRLSVRIAMVAEWAIASRGRRMRRAPVHAANGGVYALGPSTSV